MITEGIKMNANIRALTQPAGSCQRAYFAAAALAFALAVIPPVAHAQGIIGGAERGSREGGRAAGPVGAVVGGAVGAGVGGAVGAVNGVLGIPHRHYYHHCHGFHDRYGHFHCYR
jgi:hypothetical protein